MRYLVHNAAVERLGWILDGLDGVAGWGADAAEVIAPAFAAEMPLDRLVERTRERSAAYAPVTVVGIDVTEHKARARVRAQDGTISVVTCEVQPLPPHRIISAWTTGLVPDVLTPRLPTDFTEYSRPGHASGSQLIVFSGLPGCGKSTLADAVGRRLGIPVFAVDWLLGALTPFGGYHLDSLWDIGTELLTTLALRQLSLGQSAILDCPAEDPAERTRWRSLAQRAGSDFRVCVCVCPDLQVHRARLESRKRGIPGWHDTGNWDEVQRRITAFRPWTDAVLTVDTTEPHELNVTAVLDYLRAS